MSVSTSTFDNPIWRALCSWFSLRHCSGDGYFHCDAFYQETEEEDDALSSVQLAFALLENVPHRLVQFLDLLWYVALYMGSTSPVYWLLDLHEGCIED
ncbi:MAG: hypothetical protein ACLS3M_13505 [Collinsella sp.]